MNPHTPIPTEIPTSSQAMGQKKSDKKGRRKRIPQANLVYNTGHNNAIEHPPLFEEHVKVGTSKTLSDLG